MTSKKLVGLRLTESKINILKERAKQDNRSLNNLLEVIIDNYIKGCEQSQLHERADSVPELPNSHQPQD